MYDAHYTPFGQEVIRLVSGQWHHLCRASGLEYPSFLGRLDGTCTLTREFVAMIVNYLRNSEQPITAEEASRLWELSGLSNS